MIVICFYKEVIHYFHREWLQDVYDVTPVFGDVAVHKII